MDDLIGRRAVAIAMVTASGILAVTAKGQIHDGIHPVNGGVVQLAGLHWFVGHFVVLVRGKANARRSHFQQVAKLCDETFVTFARVLEVIVIYS